MFVTNNPENTVLANMVWFVFENGADRAKLTGPDQILGNGEANLTIARLAAARPAACAVASRPPAAAGRPAAATDRG